MCFKFWLKYFKVNLDIINWHQNFWVEILILQNMIPLILVLLPTDKKTVEALEILIQLSCFDSVLFLLRLNLRNISSFMLSTLPPFSLLNSHCSFSNTNTYLLQENVVQECLYWLLILLRITLKKLILLLWIHSDTIYIICNLTFSLMLHCFFFLSCLLSNTQLH